MEKVIGEDTLKSKVKGKMILLTPTVIASYMGYQRPPTAEITYSREGYESPKGDGLAELVCTDLAAYRAKGHYTQGLLKPKFALMNKMVHYVLYPRGAEKTPKEEVIQLVYELYYGEKIDISLFIWEFVSRFPDQCGNSSSLPFSAMITALCLSAGIKPAAREVCTPPPLGPISLQTFARSISQQAAVQRPRAPPPPVIHQGTGSSPAVTVTTTPVIDPSTSQTAGFTFIPTPSPEPSTTFAGSDSELLQEILRRL